MNKTCADCANFSAEYCTLHRCAVSYDAPACESYEGEWTSYKEGE